jgi:hypothetical protein
MITKKLRLKFYIELKKNSPENNNAKVLIPKKFYVLKYHAGNLG